MVNMLVSVASFWKLHLKVGIVFELENAEEVTVMYPVLLPPDLSTERIVASPRKVNQATNLPARRYRFGAGSPNPVRP